MTIMSKKRISATKTTEKSNFSWRATSISCFNCLTEIEDHRFKCAVCKEVNLCVSCFSEGSELGEHKKTHDYLILKKHTFPIFDPDWGADEELLLIEALEIYGMGSWEDAAEYVGSKTKEECESHYIKIHMQSVSRPLPDVNKDFDASIDTAKSRKFLKLTASKKKDWYSLATSHEIEGFMPGRFEFEAEFDNEAENIIKELSFWEKEENENEVYEEGEGGIIEQTEFKLALLDAYNNKLNKREYIKRFLIERGITDYKKNQAIDKKRSMEEKLLYNSFKVFARLHTSDDHSNLIKGLLQEQELKVKIAKLQEYRQIGIQTFVEAKKYDKAKRLRDSSMKTDPSREKLNLINNGSHILSQSMQDESIIVNWNQPPPAEPTINDLFDLTDSECFELLSSGEAELCSSIRMYPKTYVLIKQTILQEFLLNGPLQCHRVCELVAHGPSKGARIYEFFIKAKWIVSGSSQ